LSAPERPPAVPGLRFALAVVLAGGALLRTAWISADPAMRISWSNGIFTDPPVMVHAARNAALFGKWIVDYNHDLWVFPLMNALTRLVYLVSGPGRVPTIWLSAAAGVAVAAAVAWGLGRSLGPRAAAMGGGLASVCYFLVMFARIPVAENVVAALLMTAAALAMGRRPAEFAAAGALGVGATLFGKYHAVGFLPGLVAFVALRPAARRNLAALLAGGTAVFLGWLVFLFLPHRGEILSHVARQSTGIHGDLPFVVSLGQGLGEFYNTVRRCWMFYRMPVAASVGGLFLLWTAGNAAARRARLADGTAVYAFAFLSFWLYLGLLPYKAPRYFVMIAPLLVAGAAAGLELALRRESWKPRPPVRWDEHLPLAVWIYSFAFTGLDAAKHYASMALEYLSTPPPRISDATYNAVVRLFAHIDTFHQGLVWAGILGIVAYVCALWNPEILARLGRRDARLDARGLRRAVAAALVLAVAAGLGQWGWWAAHRTRFVEDAKSSLPLMVGEKAVVLGPFAPLMTQDSRLRAYPYFGPPGERGLLEKYGITHVMLAGKGDRTLIESRFPGLLDSTSTVQSWPVRTLFSGVMELRRLPASYRGVPVHDYRPTPFEQGVTALQEGRPEEALERFEEHRAGHGEFPELVSLESACWFRLGDYDEAEKGIREAIRLRPGDPSNYRSLSLVHLKRGERPEAVRCLLTALRLDPTDEELRSMLQELVR